MWIYVPYNIFKMQDYILSKILAVTVEILLFPINALIGLRILTLGIQFPSSPWDHPYLTLTS
jgi:hypothetical protein